MNLIKSLIARLSKVAFANPFAFTGLLLYWSLQIYLMALLYQYSISLFILVVVVINISSALAMLTGRKSIFKRF